MSLIRCIESNPPSEFALALHFTQGGLVAVRYRLVSAERFLLRPKSFEYVFTSAGENG